MFDELCLPYKPDFLFYEGIGITNNHTNIKLGDYYYLERNRERFGEEITYEQFKASFEKPVEKKKDNLKYLIKLFKDLNIK
jgi:hypothetical protein